MGKFLQQKSEKSYLASNSSISLIVAVAVPDFPTTTAAAAIVVGKAGTATATIAEIEQLLTK